MKFQTASQCCAKCLAIHKHSSGLPPHPNKLQQPGHSLLQIPLTPLQQLDPAASRYPTEDRARAPRSRSLSRSSIHHPSPQGYNPRQRSEGARGARLTVGAEGGARNGGELAAGVDVLEHGLLEPGEVAVALLEHRLDPVARHGAEPHHRRLRLRRGGGGLAAGDGRRRRRGGSAGETV